VKFSAMISYKMCL